MKLLTALNTILPYLQVGTVTSTTDRSPAVGSVLAALDSERLSLLNREFWFNSRETTLPLTPEGYIETPAAILGMYPLDTYENIEVRGEYLYNLSTSTQVFAGPLKVRLVDDLEFEQLPESAAEAVLYAAALAAYTPDWGVDGTSQYLAGKQSAAEATLQREHLRKRKFSACRRRTAIRIASALRS